MPNSKAPLFPTMNVEITTFVNPHLFWMIDVESQTRLIALEELEKYMEECCKNHPSDCDVTFHVGDIVVVKYNGSLYRAILEHIGKKGSCSQYRCWLIDYGTMIESNAIYKSRPVIRCITPLARQASLNNVVYTVEHLGFGETGSVVKTKEFRLSPTPQCLETSTKILSMVNSVEFCLEEKDEEIYFGDILYKDENGDKRSFRQYLIDKEMIQINEELFPEMKCFINYYKDTNLRLIEKICTVSSNTINRKKACKEIGKNVVEEFEEIEISEEGYIPQAGYYPRHNLCNAQQQPERFAYDGRHNIRGHYPYYDDQNYGQFTPGAPHNPGDPYTVRLRVGEREYPGQGYTVLQDARHDAAAKAIEHIQQLKQNDDSPNSSMESGGQMNDGEPSAPESVSSDINTDLKSPISLVYEIAVKRNLNVTFEVLSEKGPPHMKVFVTQCRVGNFVAEGKGNSKQISKKRSAEKMLEKLSKLPSLLDMNKKTRNLIKVKVDKASETVGEINPISRLIQIQQANEGREPVYTVLEERGAPNCREFVIEASVNGYCCTGVGPNKKIAKWNAAEALLAELGYSTNATSNKPGCPRTNKEPESNVMQHCNDKGRKVNVDKVSESVGEINPISLLIQIQQANEGREPVYTVLEERGAPNCREFVIEASVNGHCCTGVGPNKKIAKWNAAEALLAELGHSTNAPSNKPGCPKTDKEPVSNVMQHCNDKGRKGVRSQDELLYLAQLQHRSPVLGLSEAQPRNVPDAGLSGHESTATVLRRGTNDRCLPRKGSF